MAGIAEATSVRCALRDATHDVHERLHRLPLFERLLAGALTRHDYGRLLSRLYGFHKPVEDALLLQPAPQGAEHAWKGLARVHRLEADLRFLGLDPARLPRMTPPPISAPAGLLGMLYVRDGSTLGGRVLARALDGLLGKGIQGRAFLAGSDLDVACWQATCAALEQHAGDLHEMMAAASATFSAFETWFGSGDAGAPDGGML